MKTFIRVYNKKTKMLEDNYFEQNNPENSFGNWISNHQNDFDYEEIKKKSIFFNTASNYINEQMAGVIKFDKGENRFIYEYEQIYFHLNTEGSHWIIKNSSDIFWSDLYDSYFLKSDSAEFDDYEDEEDLIELSEDLDVVIISEEIFLKNRQEYDIYMFEDIKKKNLEKHISFKINKLFKKCRKCKNENTLSISNMVEGNFICQYCKSKN